MLLLTWMVIELVLFDPCYYSFNINGCNINNRDANTNGHNETMNVGECLEYTWRNVVSIVIILLWKS